MAGETAAPVGNNIPTGLINQAAQGGGDQGGGGGADGRARIGEFGRFSSNSGDFRGQAGEANERMQPVLERPVSDNFADHMGLNQGLDAQSQALALDDSEQGEVLEGDDAQAEYDARVSDTKKWSEAERADDLAEWLGNKLVTVTVAGEQFRIPVSEAVGGYMMQADYSSKLGQVYALRDQVAHYQRTIDNFVMQFKSGGQPFLDTVEAMGPDFFKSFAEAAIIYGTMLDAEQRMSPEQRAAVAAAKQERSARMALERRLKEMEARLLQTQQPQVSRNEQYYLDRIKQMYPVAIERMAKRGWEWVESPFTLQLFEQHWANLIKNLDGKDLTSQFLEDALIGVMQQVQSLARAGHIQAPRPVAAGKVPPVSQLAGPSQPMANGQNGRRQKRARISDLGSMVTKG